MKSSNRSAEITPAGGAKPKLIAMYLPQYHEIPENSRFWGEGYTDWVAVRKSTPLYKGHIQPKTPLNQNYYDLSEKSSIQWQAKLAKENGIYGFGIYHYWFDSQTHLLKKPAEIILANPDIDMHYCFVWDNASWRRTWSNVKIGNDWAPMYDANDDQLQKNGVLAELKYGGKDEWKKHFEYLLPYFKDKRYIRIQDKPVFGFFNQDNEPEVLARMAAYWEELAVENGLPGLAILGKLKNNGISFSEYRFWYQPEWCGWTWNNPWERVRNKAHNVLSQLVYKLNFYQYDVIWKRIIRAAEKCRDDKLLYSGFVTYDDSPRRGRKGKIVRGASPEKFARYLGKLVDIAKAQNKEYVFLIAWNEWGEGAYLEPDETDGYGYLQAIQNVLNDCK